MSRDLNTIIDELEDLFYSNYDTPRANTREYIAEESERLRDEFESMDIEDILSEDEIEARYICMLDDCHEPVDIAGLTYGTSRALKLTDPVAYRCGLADYSSEISIENEYPEEVQKIETLLSDIESLLEEMEEEEGGDE